MMLSTSLLLLSLSPLIASHASHAPSDYRSTSLISRRALEKRCGSQLSSRRQKRSEEHLAKRASGQVAKRATSNDSTCILTPEVTQGPYHILGEIVRQNITEGQAGVPLQVSIDFIDISTCQPVQVWVDAWHANATGYYSGYVSETGSTISSGGGSGGGGMNSTSGAGGINGTMPSGASGSMSMGAAPTGAGGMGSSTTNSSDLTATSGADSAGSSLTETPSDASTFLRGAWLSDAEGHLTMYSIVPGWYSGRAQHFHIKAYPSSEAYQAANGTFVVKSDAVHTGQFFYDNATLNAVAGTSIYSANSIAWADRVTNEADTWYPYEAADGNTADMEITWVGDDIMDGLIGQITVGLNMTYDSPELSTEVAAFNATQYSLESLLPTATLSVGASTSPAAFAATSVKATSASAASASAAATSSASSAGNRNRQIPASLLVFGKLTGLF